ncbi:DoxX family protein [Thalassobaculum sp.]|uniref:DoxX family protein n=1 Tax=Thalassobaculum sp. TaxID=2022740 RepID=UPI0032EC7DBF
MSPDDGAVSIGALLLRLALGAMWLSHALMKIVVFTVPGFAAWLDGLGLPGFLAGPVLVLEIVGGTALILGVWPRLVAPILIPILAVAMWTHLPNGWLFTNTGGGWEYPAYLIVASIAQALIGDGAWAARRTPSLGALRRAIPV